MYTDISFEKAISPAAGHPSKDVPTPTLKDRGHLAVHHWKSRELECGEDAGWCSRQQSKADRSDVHRVSWAACKTWFGHQHREY